MAAITGNEYTAILQEREAIKEKLDAAAGESDFMRTHYKRMWKAVNVSYKQALTANISLENREVNKVVKEKAAARKAQQRRDWHGDE
jgi:hypothetical protein